MPPRFRDWATRLDAFLSSRSTVPFAWASNDCCIFSADAVLAETGYDPAHDLRGTYRNMVEAVAVLHIHGGVERLAACRLGESVAIERARVGDVGLVDDDGRATLALCVGTGWVAPGDEGLKRVPLKMATRAWRVG
jgi:hypothetical protein